MPSQFSSLPLKLYHVTDRKNLYSIMHNGLIPRPDPHVAEFYPHMGSIVNLAASLPVVNMFKGWLHAAGWLTDPVVIEVEFPISKLRKLSDDWYVSTHKIPPSALSYNENIRRGMM